MWNALDQEDADYGASWGDGGGFSYDLGTPGGDGGTVAYTPSQQSQGSLWDRVTGAANKASNAVAWDRVLDKGLSAWLQHEQLGAQKDLLMAGRTVGYRPLTFGQPLGYGQNPLPMLLLIGGAVWLMSRAAK